MKAIIRHVYNDDISAIVELALLAWAPVFHSFESVLGPEIYGRLYPDWRRSQAAAVDRVCRHDHQNAVWVAELDGIIAGFVAFTLNSVDKVGEVQLLAVHPDQQGRGIGTELNSYALNMMKEGGMTLAVADTGGDPSHAPARRSYEKAGYRALPLVRYYKDLTKVCSPNSEPC